MTAFFRFFTIALVFLRYRLDLLSDKKPPMLLRFVCGCFPKKDYSRGERLRLACEALGPIFIKFGQLLSTRPDLIPHDMVQELNHLQDNVPPFSSAHFKQIVEQSLDASVDTIFSHFGDDPLASASIAQVHTATLKNGQEVVVKVIRPDIALIIKKDVTLLLWIAKRVENWVSDGKRLRPVEIVEDYGRTIFDELDLLREGANASQLRRNFEHSPLLYIPEIMWEYSSKSMLVMERIYGIPVANIDELTAQNTDMKKLAERGVEIFFTQVFEHNFFHADMHPGNIFVSRKHPQSPQYIAVDMAIVGSLSREDQFYLARNLLAMFRRDYRQVAELHIQSGWVPSNTRVDEFESAVRTVCEPIFQKPLDEISFGHVLISLFQTAQRFNMEIQPQLVLLQKTLLNIEGLGRQLYPALDLWETAHPYLERWIRNRFHPKTLLKEFKRSAPEWMEKLPQVPSTLFNGLDAIEELRALTPQVQQVAADYQQAKLGRRKKTYLSYSTIALVAAALISSSADVAAYLLNMPLLTVGFLGVAVFCWLIR
ncbi:MAG: ubiquinone biosynthesis protein [Candidatus Endobugula sp.]|jgi:ubiquinone biosynthesis protein